MALDSVSTEERGVASGTDNTIRQPGTAVPASILCSYGGYTSRSYFVDGLRHAVLVGAT